MTISRHYVLAAGGTGGHMIPAFALGAELIRRGHHVALVTDERGTKIPGCPEKIATHILPAGRMSGGPIGWLRGARAIGRGREMAKRLYSNFEPSCVIGFGGYPAFPALLGAFANKVPTIIHEQNAVLGRVNRLSASKVNAIVTAYPDIKRLKPRFPRRCLACAMRAIRRWRRMVFSECSLQAAAKGQRYCRRSFPMAWPACRSICAAGCKLHSNAVRKILKRYVPNIPIIKYRRSWQPIFPICLTGWAGRIW